jgi:hypothetical protein
MACGPEFFSVEFSAPPEFSGGLTEKYLSTGWAQTFDLLMKQLFYHCATSSLSVKCYGIHCVPSWDFPARFCSYWQPNFPAVSGSYLPGFSGRICSYWQPNFPAVSVVTCRDFLVLPFPARECKKKVSLQRPEGPDFPAVSVVSGQDFPAVAFLAWVILKNSMGGRKIVLVSTAGFSFLNTGIFWRKAKTKRLFSQCRGHNALYKTGLILQFPRQK